MPAILPAIIYAIFKENNLFDPFGLYKTRIPFFEVYC